MVTPPTPMCCSQATTYILSLQLPSIILHDCLQMLPLKWQFKDFSSTAHFCESSVSISILINAKFERRLPLPWWIPKLFNWWFCSLFRLQVYSDLSTGIAGSFVKWNSVSLKVTSLQITTFDVPSSTRRYPLDWIRSF